MPAFGLGWVHRTSLPLIHNQYFLYYSTYIPNKKAGKIGNAIELALKEGYRLIDCAHIYRNEVEIGEALHKCFKEGVVNRGDVFVTSKLWCEWFYGKTYFMYWVIHLQVHRSWIRWCLPSLPTHSQKLAAWLSGSLPCSLATCSGQGCSGRHTQSQGWTETGLWSRQRGKVLGGML